MGWCWPGWGRETLSGMEKQELRAEVQVCELAVCLFVVRVATVGWGRGGGGVVVLAGGSGAGGGRITVSMEWMTAPNKVCVFAARHGTTGDRGGADRVMGCTTHGSRHPCTPLLLPCYYATTPALDNLLTTLNATVARPPAQCSCAQILLYLHDTEEGGETAFPETHVDVTPELEARLGPFSSCARGRVAFRPRKGDALMFWSLKPDGTHDDMSSHEGEGRMGGFGLGEAGAKVAGRGAARWGGIGRGMTTALAEGWVDRGGGWGGTVDVM